MRYNLLGRTGLKVSELCLGTMTFGGWEVIGALTQDEASNLVNVALDAGINFFDTADAYSHGEAEKMLGRALGTRRREVVVASKVRLETGPGPNQVGLSRFHIIEAVEGSLRRLNTDYIDLYQTHLNDSVTPLEETLRALDDLVTAGKVRYIGCSNIHAWQVMKGLGISEKNGWVKYCAFQGNYTLVERGMERELIPMLKDQQLGLMVWSPLSGGFLSGKFKRGQEPPEDARRSQFDFPPVHREVAYRAIDALEEIAKRENCSVARVALAWLLHQEVVTSVILGAKRPDQLRDNLQATEVRLSSEDLIRLNDSTTPTLEYPGWMMAHPWDDRM
jgi:aryl-alcohol dehydrogenase-like predicted oxidoreductase